MLVLLAGFELGNFLQFGWGEQSDRDSIAAIHPKPIGVIIKSERLRGFAMSRR